MLLNTLVYHCPCGVTPPGLLFFCSHIRIGILGIPILYSTICIYLISYGMQEPQHREQENNGRCFRAFDSIFCPLLSHFLCITLRWVRCRMWTICSVRYMMLMYYATVNNSRLFFIVYAVWMWRWSFGPVNFYFVTLLSTSNQGFCTFKVLSCDWVTLTSTYLDFKHLTIEGL
jgi:hypothetical protein